MNNKKTALVFPGQGTQRPGMGRDFYDNIPESRKTFEEASQTLGWDVAALCFGDDERLDLTEYAQPCILATEIAMFRGIASRYEFKPDYFGGHSLGEYTALVAAGAIPFSDALKTVQARGRLMQQASPAGAGGMAAVIAERLDIDGIAKTLEGLPLDVANINSSGQVVISGRADSMDIAQIRLEQTAKNDRPLRFVHLNVSAPFHSRFMLGIKDAFKNVLDSISATVNPDSAGRVTSNYTGGFHTGGTAKIIEALVAQLSNSVKWLENMQVLVEKASQIYEVGPNRPLKNFFTDIKVNCRSITSFAAAKREFA